MPESTETGQDTHWAPRRTFMFVLAFNVAAWLTIGTLATTWLEKNGAAGPQMAEDGPGAELDRIAPAAGGR